MLGRQIIVRRCPTFLAPYSSSSFSILCHKSIKGRRVSPHRGRLVRSTTSALMSSTTPGPPTTKIQTNNTKKPFVQIVEVGPRDGLQNESQIITTSQKVTLIRKLMEAGCSHIEVGAFVSPQWVPQMKDTPDVLNELQKLVEEEDFKKEQCPRFSCLVPNLEGWERAQPFVANGTLQEIALFASASETFSQTNLACSIDESMDDRFPPVLQAAQANSTSTQAPPLAVRGYVSTIIACPYEGPIAPPRVAHVVERLLRVGNDDGMAGVYQVSLGDTIGVGTPGSFRAMLEEVLKIAPSSQLALHCHDTYGQALANIAVGLEYGIHTIDSSIAGLGGCPYAKGASGNVATEDVVYMLHGMGYETGLDLEKLVDAGDYICKILNKPTQSKVAAALLAARDG